MHKGIVNYFGTMKKNAGVLTVICLLLCLSFNYTFPLRREITKGNGLINNNDTLSHGIGPLEHSDSIVDRTKKMASNIEHALKNIIDLTPDKVKIERETKRSQDAHAKHVALDSDLSNYEQLVIMKKYPFLDLQELDFNYRPPQNKNIRQSVNSGPNIGQDPSFCESSDDGPNVEITNRGLSGFAIPTKIIKTGNVPESKTNINDSFRNANDNKDLKTLNQHSDDLRILENLEEDIKKFEKHLG